jgi:hypothetical protein
MLTETDSSVLEGLDFEFVQPCEHPRHSSNHADQPAMFLLRRLNPCCGVDHYFICLDGWEKMGKVGGLPLSCMFCHKYLGPSREDVLKIVKVIGT